MDASDVSEPGPSQNPALDFFSPSFDPALALAMPGLQPPDPDALPRDNVSSCRAILPPELPESLANVVKKQATEESKLKAMQFKERASKLTQRVQESCQMSLDRVMRCVKPGPVRVLGTWLQAGLRVRVVTRHARGVRGTATGQLVAYDRFMNVVLRDVHEEYTVRVRVMRERPSGGGAAAAPGAPTSSGVAAAVASATAASRDAGVTFVPNPVSAADDPVEPGELGEIAVRAAAEKKVRWAHRQDHRQRQLAQIFIKGDNIVCVSREDQLTRVPRRDKL